MAQPPTAMTNHPEFPRLAATVWLLHEHDQRLLAAEGLTTHQAWQAFHPLERAAVFNQVELHIDPDRAPDAISRWEPLASRTGICVAETRLVSPRTIAFDTASPSNPAFHDPAKLLRMPYDARPVAIPHEPRATGSACSSIWPTTMASAPNPSATYGPSQSAYDHGYPHPSLGLEPPR